MNQKVDWMETFEGSDHDLATFTDERNKAQLQYSNMELTFSMTVFFDQNSFQEILKAFEKEDIKEILRHIGSHKFRGTGTLKSTTCHVFTQRQQERSFNYAQREHQRDENGRNDRS